MADFIEQKTKVVEAGIRLQTEQLVARTWGNVSCRIDETHYAITPSGISYDSLTPDDIVVMDMETGEHEGSHKPSGERGIHTASYKTFSEANFVIHTHQTFATAISLAGFDAMKLSDEEKSKLGSIALADYGLPGMKKLTKAVSSCLGKGANIVLMAHHGVLIVGGDEDDAFNKAKLLEEVCKRTVISQCPYLENASTTFKKQNDGSLLVASPAISKLFAEGIPIDVQLDDLAQMVGSKGVPVSDSLGKNQAAMTKDGILVKAENEKDTEALALLCDKAAICKAYTESLKAKAKLGALDVSLMHLVYTKKYAKQNQVAPAEQAQSALDAKDEKPSKKKEVFRVLKFALFSASAGIIEIITFTLLNELIKWPYWPCYLIALVLSVLWNFTFNRKFTFKSAANVPIAMLKVAAFYAVFTPVTTILGNFLSENLHWNEYIVTGLNMALNLITEYLFDKFVVYRGQIDNNKKAKQQHNESSKEEK